MNRLPADWLTKDLIDFEYKKYVLLAYLQSVKQNFQNRKLFPDLQDLQVHYKASGELVHQKKILKALFPKDVLGVDTSSFQLLFKEMENDLDVLKEIEEILQFALPQFEKALEAGEELQDEVNQFLEISPVGILPLEKKEGYILVYEHVAKNTSIFRYQVSLFESMQSRYPRLNTTYLSSEPFSLSQTFTSIKRNLIQKYKELPNPATVLVEVRKSFPLRESVLPLAQKKVSAFLCEKTV